MAAFQFEEQIFYHTCKSVYPGSELLLWYGDQYAGELGVYLWTEMVCYRVCEYSVDLPGPYK